MLPAANSLTSTTRSIICHHLFDLNDACCHQLVDLGHDLWRLEMVLSTLGVLLHTQNWIPGTLSVSDWMHMGESAQLLLMQELMGKLKDWSLSFIQSSNGPTEMVLGTHGVLLCTHKLGQAFRLPNTLSVSDWMQDA